MEETGVPVKKRRIFSELEKHLLVELIEKEKSVVEQRQNTASILKAKNDAWGRILTAFNAQKGIENTDVKTLRKVWDNIKTKAKKDVSKEKKDRHATGGGPADPEAAADDMSHLVSSICSDVMTPLDNDIDDDAGYHVQAPVNNLEQPAASVAATTSEIASETNQASSVHISRGKAKRKSADEHSTNTPTSSAFDRALNMQEIEHELQVKRLKQKIKFDEEEHMERMNLLKLQQQFVTRLNENVVTTSNVQTQPSYSHYNIYEQM